LENLNLHKQHINRKISNFGGEINFKKKQFAKNSRTNSVFAKIIPSNLSEIPSWSSPPEPSLHWHPMGAFGELLKTITEITEERQTFRISISVYCIAILIFFSEVTGYVFYSTPHRMITEEKVNSLSLFLLGSTYPYLLNLVGYDALTVVFIYLSCISVFLLTGYILMLTLCRQTFPKVIQSN